MRIGNAHLTTLKMPNEAMDIDEELLADTKTRPGGGTD